jgi:hypothetical protein
VADDAEATPFDTGCLAPMDGGGARPRLQPWTSENASEADRLALVREHTHRVAELAPVLDEWLVHCYGETPSRYLDSSEDRFAAGEPERTRPQQILEHNGTRGRALYGENKCADRRAWTWEVRVSQPVPLAAIALIHLPRAKAVARLEREEDGVGPRLLALADTEPSDATQLYVQSRSALEALLR